MVGHERIPLPVMNLGLLAAFLTQDIEGLFRDSLTPQPNIGMVQAKLGAFSEQGIEIRL